MHRTIEKGTQMSNRHHTIGSLLHRLGVAGPARSGAFQGIGALIAVLGSLVFAAAPAQAAIAHKYVSSLTGEPGGSFGTNVCGVAVDPATGDVYVADRENNVIDIFEPAGASAYTYKSQISGVSIPFGSFGNAFIQAPCSVAVSDVTGDVYFAGSSENGGSTEDVIVFNDLGDWIKTMNGAGTPKEGGTPQGGFGAGSYVGNVAVNQSSGEVYIASSKYELVDRFNSANEYESQFSAPDEPEWLATNSGGDIYDYSRGEVYEFNSSGSQIAEITVSEDSAGSSSVAVDSAGNVYVTHEGSFYETSQEPHGHPTPVDQYNPAGELEGETRGTPSGPFSKPESVAANPGGELLVADRSSSGVLDSRGAVYLFGAGVLVPGTSVQAPSGVEPTTAVLNGSVNPAGSEVMSCEFEYGTSTSYGESVPCEQTAGSGTSAVAVTAKPSGLQPDTTYHYRLNAANVDGGNAYEAGTNDEVFTTPGVPRIDSESTEVKSTEKAGQTHATLKAQITPDSLAEHETTYQFEYGETEHYGTSIPVSPGDIGSGEVPVSVEAALSGLTVGTTYHYRVLAENEFGTEYGPDQTFTTVAAVLIEGTSVSKVTETSTTFNAQVDSLGTDTHAYFQYGTANCAISRSSCADTPEVDVGSAEGYQSLSVHLQGLVPSTVYYYRVIATNALGTVEGEHNEKGEELVHTFTTQAPGTTLTLPDDRAWELVSPPDKHGALIYPINEYEGVIEAAANGAAVTYETNAPIEASPQGYPYRDDQVLARRTSGGWSDQDIDTPHNYESGISLDNGYEYKFFSPDLSLALVEPGGLFTPLEHDGVSEEVSPRATERGEYVRSDFTCQATPTTCYTPLVTEANTPPETKIGAEEEEDPATPSAVRFIDATPDLSHVVLRSAVPLIEGAPAGSLSASGSGALYEWSGGRLQLVSVLPASEGGAGVLAQLGGPGSDELDARNAIASDGSRVIWTSLTNNGLYMSDTAGGKTEVVRIGEAGATVIFTDANSDDSKVFFTQGGEADSIGNHGDLYVFEVTSGAGEPLADRVTRLTEGAEVQGAVLGASEDGSYVYFVAAGVLTGGANAQGEKAVSDADNLYVDHYNGEARQWEAPVFIATLAAEDRYDWLYGEPMRRTSEVSPSGHYLAFMSQRSLTGYDNTDVNEATGKHADEEVYLYDAVEHRLVCASCNPTGARPVGAETTEAGVVDDNMWSAGTWLAANVPGYTTYDGPTIALYQSRYLSNSGRLFFNSHEALVPQDVNGQWDVYEYEPPRIGNCTTETATFSVRSDGCVGLISSGESAEEAGFLDASENGDDVFFLTTSRLSLQDIDNDYDVYDAHVCGAEGVPCTTSVAQPPACTTEASCKSAPEPQPSIYGLPSSAGNLAPPAEPKPAVKPKPKSVTRAQKLSAALKACHKKKGKPRAKCEKTAHKQYGAKAKKAKRASDHGRAK